MQLCIFNNKHIQINITKHILMLKTNILWLIVICKSSNTHKFCSEPKQLVNMSISHQIFVIRHIFETVKKLSISCNIWPDQFIIYLYIDLLFLMYIVTKTLFYLFAYLSQNWMTNNVLANLYLHTANGTTIKTELNQSGKEMHFVLSKYCPKRIKLELEVKKRA